MVPRDQGGLKPKYIRFTITKDKGNQKTVTLEKLETVNFDSWLQIYLRLQGHLGREPCGDLWDAFWSTS